MNANSSAKSRQLNSRGVAAVAALRVVDGGRPISDALHDGRLEVASRDRAFVSELVNGVTRWYWYLDDTAGQILHRKFRNKDRDLHCLLLVGLYQLQFMDTPDYATLSMTVEAAKELRKSWAASAISGALHHYIGAQAEIDERELTDSARYAHPQWLIDLIRQEWPEHWRGIVEANNARPKMVLRVNRKVCTAGEYVRKLSEAGIDAERDPAAPFGVRLHGWHSVDDLPGFRDGWCSVQDTSSQLVAPLLEVAPGERVLDACAAPGGKTLHILQQQPEAREVVAIDADAKRCELIEENLQRSGESATLRVADLENAGAWNDGRGFDKILLDAPCSGLGVVNRHPDIKHHRKPGDLDAYADRQRALLESVWPALNPGGLLVYSTCSIISRENQSAVKGFLDRHDDCAAEAVPDEFGLRLEVGAQRLQGVHHGDGFYVARLRRAG